MSVHKLRLGVAGLGRAFSIMLPTLSRHPRLRLVAAADPRAEARSRFAIDFGGHAYATVEDICADRDVEAIYIASPHQLHAEHVRVAASRGKHILLEKPMALTMADCDAMIEAVRSANVCLVVGHSHSFDAPISQARQIILSGAVGAVRMISALNYTDFLYRPRRPEELVTEKGGGVIFSQGAHQIDIIRLLGGGRLKSVRAGTGGVWDPLRPSEGAYTAFITFEDGAVASAIYSGYAHFDSDEFMGWIGEMGSKKDPAQYGAARKILAKVSSRDEARLKNARNYGGPEFAMSAGEDFGHQHFGTVIVSCEKADLRPLPQGVMVYGDKDARLHALPKPTIPRAEVIDEFYEAIFYDRPPIHTGEWARATLEVCLAILRSSQTGAEIMLSRQTDVGGDGDGAK